MIAIISLIHNYKCFLNLRFSSCGFHIPINKRSSLFLISIRSFEIYEMTDDKTVLNNSDHPNIIKKLIDHSNSLNFQHSVSESDHFKAEERQSLIPNSDNSNQESTNPADSVNSTIHRRNQKSKNGVFCFSKENWYHSHYKKGVFCFSKENWYGSHSSSPSFHDSTPKPFIPQNHHIKEGVCSFSKADWMNQNLTNYTNPDASCLEDSVQNPDLSSNQDDSTQLDEQKNINQAIELQSSSEPSDPNQNQTILNQTDNPTSVVDKSENESTTIVENAENISPIIDEPIKETFNKEKFEIESKPDNQLNLNEPNKESLTGSLECNQSSSERIETTELENVNSKNDQNKTNFTHQIQARNFYKKASKASFTSPVSASFATTLAFRRVRSESPFPQLPEPPPDVADHSLFLWAIGNHTFLYENM